MRIFGFSMIRNEIDIAQLFIRQIICLFDKFIFVDVMSTDGTQELLSEVARGNENIIVYKCSTREKYQAAIMNFLAREALRDGADWLFFLDADEFIPIESRAELEQYLSAFDSEVMSLPWINLVPSRYSDFSSFNVEQEFYWSGRTSPISKIAVSSLYFHNHPDAFVTEGNRSLCQYKNGPPALRHLGLPLLHVPVRSRQRLTYKIANTFRLLKSNHDTEPRGSGEDRGRISALLDTLGDDVAPAEYLNAIAADYGQPGLDLERLAPNKLDWPVKLLPRYGGKLPGSRPQALTVGTTLAADMRVDWRNPEIIPGSTVTAAVEGDELLIVSQPVSGRLRPRYGRFETLSPINKNVAPDLDPNAVPRLLGASLGTSLLPTRFETSATRSQSIPVLLALLPLVRPRRYVEFGVDNGVSFFTACQASHDIGTSTECVAIDSWVDGSQNSSRLTIAFDEFRETLVDKYPDASFIRGTFIGALQCFGSKSIDLLHIGGDYTNEMVKENIYGWLGKMSDTGVILLRSTNVTEHSLGVWQLWQELRQRYLNLSFLHSHGLGVLYVGCQQNAIATAFRWLDENPAYFSVVQTYLTILGENFVEHKVMTDELRKAQKIGDNKDCRIDELRGYILQRDTSLHEIVEERNQKVDALNKRILELDEVIRQVSNESKMIQALSVRKRSIGDRGIWENGRLSISFNPQSGSATEHATVIAEALRRLICGITICQFMFLPIRAARRRYRKQVKMAKELSKGFLRSQ